MSRESHVERADAARNRAAILAAATELIRERGIEAVSIDDVAAAAGVGKGTVFRRFGDKAGLIQAVVDETAASWIQVASLECRTAGEFAGTLFDHVLASLPLVIAIERTSVRSCEGNFQITVDRLARLVGSTFKAHTVLAVLRGEHIAFLLDQGMTAADVREGVISLADTLAAEV
ncbi:helix-turn-helix transcriptional regulator [Lentzea sp. PSKA42]|uniref:Helix-turn-helix transcriptional regulator n=1 Tax=Lentzea indica TaxID=2604800 RepID=A0ABX1FGV6_9PSEU|nr:helix-turn-helix transcriptional regulator [Lentzea indica]